MNLLIVVTSTDAFAHRDLKTGLWLGEFTHIYHRAKLRDYGFCVASPRGGAAPIDPVSLHPILMDELTKRYWTKPSFRRALQRTERLDDLRGELFDCILLAGGHGAMYDFAQNPALQHLVAQHYRSGRIVCALCHGVCGLVDVRLPEGGGLVEGKTLTGYSRFEEVLAGRRKDVPFDLEATLRQHGAHYRKAAIPFTEKVVVEGNLVTGENPASARQTAEAVMQKLEERERAVAL